LFERPRHRAIARLLGGLHAGLLREMNCWFGGGTAMVMRFGEWRESSDIDMLISDWPSYKTLWERVSTEGIEAIGAVEPVRETVTDRYGIRTLLQSDAGPVKFEIIHEGRIELDAPGDADMVGDIATLATANMVASKLLANDDRRADTSLFSRDLIDLALLPATEADWTRGHAKAVAAYGATIDSWLGRAIETALERPGWIQRCIRELQMAVDEQLLRERLTALLDRPTD
jgi:hypothetical protein